MDEILAVYYAVSILFLCLSILQKLSELVKSWHEHVRSSRKKRRKRK